MKQNSLASQGEDILGFLDVRDVVNSLLDSLPADVVADAKLLRRMKALEDAGPKFAASPLSSLPSGYGSDGSFLPASRADRMTLLELVHDAFLFPKALPSAGAEAAGEKEGGGGAGAGGGSEEGEKKKKSPSRVSHRVALYDATGTALTAIVSQSDVCRHLSSKQATSSSSSSSSSPAALGKLGEKTVEEVGWASRGPVVSVTPETSSVSALRTMRERGIAGVAVVDSKTGKLIGNFSATELRAITADHLGALALPVAEMLALEHGLEFWGIDHSAPEAAPALEHSSKFARAAHRRRSRLGGDVGQEIAACAPGDTVASVLRKLAERGLHRLYVVDGESRPVGVVTLTDILRAAVEAAK